MRNSLKKERAAPLIALLVIILAIAAFAILPNLRLNPPNPPEEILLENTAIPPTTTAFVIDNAYNEARIRGDLSVALYYIEANAAETGWAAQDHIRAGNLWREMGDLNRALPYWEAANSLEANPNLLRQIAEIYLERGDWGIALERSQSLLALSPNDAWALYHVGLLLAPSDPVAAYPYLARVASGTGENAETAQALSSIIGTDPNNSQLVLEVGAILANAGEWSLAENAYQYAANWYYPFPEASAYVALMRVYQGKNGEAWISEALNLAPDSPLVNYVAGLYWRGVGEYAKSEDALVLAIIFEPVNPYFYAELGNTYAAMGNRIDAELWLQSAVFLAPNDVSIQTALENFYADETSMVAAPYLQFSQAPSVLNQTLSLSANGWALHLNGDSEGGLALVEQALALDPENPRALFDKARILQETGQIEQANEIFQTLAEGNSAFASIAARMLEN